MAKYHFINVRNRLVNEVNIELSEAQAIEHNQQVMKSSGAEYAISVSKLPRLKKDTVVPDSIILNSLINLG